MRVELALPSGTRQLQLAEENASVTLGKSRVADVRLADPGLADVQFRLRRRQAVLELENLAADDAEVRVNGVRAFRQQLSSGDVIECGQIRFLVTFESIVPPPPPGPSAPRPLEFVAGQVNGLCCCSGPLSASAWEAARAALRGAGHVALVANFKRGRQPLPAWLLPDEDRLAMAPESIRATSSLHLLTAELWAERTGADLSTGRAPWERGILDSFANLAALDAAVLLFHEQPGNELARALHMTLAWFAQPSSLRTTLAHGDPALAAQLLEPLAAAVIWLPGQRPRWEAYARGDLSPQLAAARLSDVGDDQAGGAGVAAAQSGR